MWAFFLVDLHVQRFDVGLTLALDIRLGGFGLDVLLFEMRYSNAFVQQTSFSFFRVLLGSSSSFD
jgi:hypothetical protein